MGSADLHSVCYFHVSIADTELQDGVLPVWQEINMHHGETLCMPENKEKLHNLSYENMFQPQHHFGKYTHLKINILQAVETPINIFDCILLPPTPPPKWEWLCFKYKYSKITIFR